MRDLIDLLENFDLTPGALKLNSIHVALKKSGFVKNGTQWVLSKDGFIVNVMLWFDKEDAGAKIVIVHKGKIVSQFRESGPHRFAELASNPEAAVDPNYQPHPAQKRFNTPPVAPENASPRTPLSSETIAKARAQWQLHDDEIEAVKTEYATRLRDLKIAQKDAWASITGRPRPT